MGGTAFGGGRCLVDRRADQRVTHLDQVAVDAQQTGGLHLCERVLGDAHGAAGATQLPWWRESSAAASSIRVWACVLNRRASVEEGSFHPGRERQVVGQRVGAGELACAQLRRRLDDGQRVPSGAGRELVDHLVGHAGARALLEQRPHRRRRQRRQRQLGDVGGPENAVGRRRGPRTPSPPARRAAAARRTAARHARLRRATAGRRPGTAPVPPR